MRAIGSPRPRRPDERTGPSCTKRSKMRSRSAVGMPRPESLALAQDHLPRQARLEALEHDLLEQPRLVVDGPAPLVVVVGGHQLGPDRPAALRHRADCSPSTVRSELYQRASSPTSPMAGTFFRAPSAACTGQTCGRGGKGICPDSTAIDARSPMRVGWQLPQELGACMSARRYGTSVPT